MKSIIFISIAIFSTVGAYIPVLFGDTDMLSGWSILCGTIGGFFGIWVGAKLAKYLR